MNTGYTLTLIYALFLAFFSVTSKKGLNKGWGEFPGLFTAFTRFMAVLALIPIALLTASEKLPLNWWVPVVITGILNIGIQYSDVKAKSLDDVSLVSPISSTTPAVVVFTSMVMLGEYPSAWGYVGILLLVIGTYVINIQAYVKKKREGGTQVSIRDWLAPFWLLAKRRGVQFAFLSALLATLSLNFDAMAYRSVNVPLAAACIFTIAASGSLGIAWITGELKKQRTVSWKYLIVPSVFLLLAILVGNYAFQYTITPYVGVLRRLSIPITIILAYLMVGEKLSFRERLVGGILMAAGAALIVLSKDIAAEVL